MSIIFPNESDMDVENLILLKKDLRELYYYDSYNVNDIKKIKTILKRLDGYLLMADRKNLFIYFNAFYEIGLLNIINDFLDKRNPQIAFSILECLYILITNIQNTGLIFYLYSIKFTTEIPGEFLNILDKIISMDISRKDEYLSYQINFIKSLTLKLNADNIEFFFNANKNQFHILHKAFSLYNYKDAMVRSAVKNVFLTILKINEEHLRKFITTFPNNIYYPNIIFQLRNIIIKLCIINFNDDRKKNRPFDIFKDEYDNLIDYIYYISDMLLLNIDNVNFILINCILNEIILPLLKTIISKKEEKISKSFALYILISFIFIVKNKFIIDVISYFLLEENISEELYEKLEEFEFRAINQNLMSCIDFLIVNNKHADVNDQQWKTIKNYMQEICGVDLSTGFVVKGNNYDIIKNIIYKKNNNDDLVKNEIFGMISMLLNTSNDNILLILNLLFYSEISFYNENNKKESKDDNNNQEHKLIDINSFKNNNTNNINNKISNNIDDNVIQKIQDELFDDDEDEEEEYEENNNRIKNNLKTKKDHIELEIDYNTNNKYNIINTKFFELKLTNTKNLINSLLKIIFNSIDLRSITNEIILFNISNLLKVHLNNEQDNKEIKLKIIQLFKNEISKLRNILKKDRSLKQLTYITAENVIEQYLNPIDKKIKDLLTTPFILIPSIYLDKIEETPEYFKEIKSNQQILKIYIMKILILYDMLNYLFNCKKDILLETKKNPFELPKQVNFIVGKEYSKLDLGKNYILCELTINKKIVKAIIFFDFQNIYFGQIMSNSYKNLSKIKLVKKYNLRNIEVRIPNNDEYFSKENSLLEIYDSSNKNVGILGQNTNLIINCFKLEKTVRVFEQLMKEKDNAMILEFSLFNSFIEKIEKKFSVN